MAKKHHPRRGSLQYWPRKRAKRQYARIRSWAKIDSTKLLAFIGYKVGMSHLIARDNTPTSITKGQNISIPVTVVECPPLKPLSLRFYKQTDSGLKIISNFLASKLDKELKRKINLQKKRTEIPQDYDDVRLVVYTQPKLTTIGKKKPEILEICVSGPTDKKLEFLKSLLEKEIRIQDVFKENQLLDVHSITKGKGFQGPRKRFGLALRQHKSEKSRRTAGNLGPWTPKKVSFRVPQPGKMGYHQRTEYNKQAIKISNKPNEINPKGGWKHYGLIKNDFIIIKGSIPGPSKRTIILTEPIRPSVKIKNLEVISIKK